MVISGIIRQKEQVAPVNVAINGQCHYFSRQYRQIIIERRPLRQTIVITGVSEKPTRIGHLVLNHVQ